MVMCRHIIDGPLGQPRVGNPSFVDYIERLIGVNNIFRGAHIVSLASCSLLRFTLVVHTWGS